ncbi:MAG: SGNH/GDSL hydrolase family protein [Endozoicomonas sp. (ex Botrylloides leachii)]|nr:SGNH/GDSL hydrolase family protein [Endozoicomonas sp. (ex Botrylloides leachii)]
MNNSFAIVTDSNGLSNKECAIKDTWVFRILKRLSEKKYVGYTFLIRSLTSKDILNFRGLKNDLFSGEYQKVILSFGIVDCSPRVLPRWILYSLRERKYFKYTINLINKKLLPIFSRYLTYQWINRKEFKENILLMKKMAESNEVYLFFTPIPPASSRLKEKMTGIEKIIDNYNEVFLECKVDLIPVNWSENANEYFIFDGYHLNPKGHSLLVESIFNHVI